MWENINGELIWIDKEMGADEYERQITSITDSLDSYRNVRAHGRQLTSTAIAGGVFGGMIAAKAVSRVGSWLLWVAILSVVAMVLM